jgi:hypothetical protein
MNPPDTDTPQNTHLGIIPQNRYLILPQSSSPPFNVIVLNHQRPADEQLVFSAQSSANISQPHFIQLEKENQSGLTSDVCTAEKFNGWRWPPVESQNLLILGSNHIDSQYYCQ